MLKVSLISDTHTKHNQITTSKSFRNSKQQLDLPGGDILIHAGDFMSTGYHKAEAVGFFEWFDSIDNYDTKIFIAGNHDRIFEDNPQWAQGFLTGYKTIEYLQDEEVVLYFDGPNGDYPEENVRIYGSPWQPEFYSWAFNLPKNGIELAGKWEAIPDNTDILITHGPAFGTLDTVAGRPWDNLGCELLAQRINQIRPKIHICGHIHSGRGYEFKNGIHFFNAAVLDEQYEYTQKPMTFDWDKDTNTIEFVK